LRQEARVSVDGAVEGAALTAANVATAPWLCYTLLADSDEKNLVEVFTKSTNFAECTLQSRFADSRKMRKELMTGEMPLKDVGKGEKGSMPMLSSGTGHSPRPSNARV